MPLRSSNPLLYAPPGLACAFLLTATMAAQVPSDLPSAPEPQCQAATDGGEQAQAQLPFPLPANYLVHFGLAGIENDSTAEEGSGDAEPTAPPEAPILNMFPHSDTAPYWVSGQANSIFQMHGHFHSPYEGTNSLIDDFETKASEVGTLYLGYQLFPNSRFNTDLIVDFENAGGRGISQALGLAGATNLDVVRNPTLSIAPYLARGEIHQIIGLTSEMVDQERGPFALAAKVPVRRFEIRIGKM